MQKNTLFVLYTLSFHSFDFWFIEIMEDVIRQVKHVEGWKVSSLSSIKYLYYLITAIFCLKI